MKIIILLSLIISSSWAAEFPDVSGSYTLTYETGIFSTQTKKIKLVLEENYDGGYGDLSFYSDQLGECSNTPAYETIKEYGYYVSLPERPVTNVDLNYAEQIHATLFCDTGQYHILIEIPVGGLETEEKASMGILIQNSFLENILKQTGIITKTK
ncbi:MAG: hypothetical protein QF441_02145 [Bacteriovoracaceae bacterium]|mgnify:CR=1 FL=1|jgi:hypothetical protein|nr:hypothetical protein [Bacteriovoracaceae bacterium]|tara:strand:- start:78 stop:542 length:465 start_codon:yes stop_codon:yes gene_type:complete